MPMDEDAMFKALLKNKPAPKQPAAGEIREETARPPSRPAVKGSEDAMYKALLHNKPPAPKPQVKAEPVQHAPQVVQMQQEPVVIAQPPPEIHFEPVVNSINDLKASVNQVHNLLKTMVLPVLVLILIVGIVILIKA